MPAKTPFRVNPADHTAAELFRVDPALIEQKLKGNDALNLTIEAKAAGYPVPEVLEQATHTAALFATVLVPQAGAGVFAAKSDLALARNQDADGAAVRKAVKAGASVVTAVKLPDDKVAKAEENLSQAERLAAATIREARKARSTYHDALRQREVVDVWAEAYADLYIEEEDLLDLTMRQANVLRVASANGRPLLEVLYMLSLVSPTNADKKELKALFAEGPREMPTMATVKANRAAVAAARPDVLAAKEREAAKARERELNKVAAAQAADSRQRRSDASVTN